MGGTPATERAGAVGVAGYCRVGAYRGGVRPAGSDEVRSAHNLYVWAVNFCYWNKRDLQNGQHRVNHVSPFSNPGRTQPTRSSVGPWASRPLTLDYNYLE